MAEASFTVSYRGPGLNDGRMAVQDLAPALLGLGDLFVEMSEIVNPGMPPVALEITATREGSFDVDLLVRTADDIINLLVANPMQALINLQAAVIGGHRGVLALIKMLGGRTVVEEDRVDAGTVRVQLDDNNVIETSPAALEGYERLTIRKSAERTVRPLTSAGVESIGFVEQTISEATVEIIRDDVPSFTAPPPEADTALSNTTEALLEIRSPVFDGGKWRVSDGESSFYVGIEDRDFIARVDSGEQFAAGDQLRCVLRTDQQRSLQGSLLTTRTIVRVEQHLHRPEPMRLDLGDEP